MFAMSRVSLVSALAGAVVCVCAPAAQADPPCWLRADVVAEVTRRVERHLGLDARVTRAMADRARRVGWAPSLSFRVARGVGAGTSLALANTTGRWTTDDSLMFDVRATFHLDHLVFDRHEIELLRLEGQRDERRIAMGNTVIDLLSVLEAARRAPDPSRELEVLRARARLEHLLGEPMEALPWR